MLRGNMPLIVALALSLWFAVLPARAQELEFFTIGACDVSGSYYASATAICASVNRSGAGRVRCSPDPTAGSIYNLDALRTGQIDFALVQSDWQRQALEGSGRFAATGPMEDLRSVMGLYPESVTLLAWNGLGITAAQDLAGLRIDIGHPSSGRHATNLQLLQALGMSRDSFELVAELPVGSAVDELCSGRIDATLLVVGHPNGGVGRALRECDIALLPVTGTELDAFLAENPD